MRTRRRKAENVGATIYQKAHVIPKPMLLDLLIRYDRPFLLAGGRVAPSHRVGQKKTHTHTWGERKPRIFTQSLDLIDMPSPPRPTPPPLSPLLATRSVIAQTFFLLHCCIITPLAIPPPGLKTPSTSLFVRGRQLRDDGSEA